MQSLNEILAAKAASVQRPEEAKQAINEAFAEIEAAGLVPGVEVGEKAPDFVLPNALGSKVRLSDRLAEGPVVLIFYRGSWCPYCNLELAAYQAVLPEFREAGARLVAVSPQLPDDALSMQEKHDLAYDVLSDAEQEVMAAYRVKFELPEKIKPHLLDATAAALARQQPDGRWSLPVPATFVLDTSGIVRARHVTMNYRTRMEPAEALRAVREIRAAAD
ncbi:AhpC/TSA family protein [Spongiactinospora rosea]|uniref:thioredoxin-dependent peroxiredoxin n=1 Tax=Spongiactinospora rosea TaxID=2248750 RepID=A0A366LPT0_9ACTN|nr:peroxiredoxin-like family protein [Spongiactinospora rosea]RBQ15901.1 AhpC/TSA family protein [Spongiactinospora rosea]